MRVISGKSKGHRLKSIKGLETRPTMDRVKESLFNMIGEINPEAIVLDLFSGSGGIGIEFLSRGAKSTYFVDKNYQNINIIKENLNHTKLSESSLVFHLDAFKALINFSKKGLSFDYIFLDPPFNDMELLLNSMELISKNNILNKFGILIVEYNSKFQLNDDLYSFTKIREKKYGNENIAFYQ